MIKAVLFDVDGVLIDSFRGNLLFFNHVLRKFGKRPMTREQYRELFSTPSDKVLLQSFPEKSAREMRHVYRYASKEAPDFYSYIRINPGVLHTLDGLKAQGLRMGIVTSRKSMAVLAHLKLSRYFKVRVGYLDVRSHKPHPEPVNLALRKLGVEPEEALYVGDSLSDLQAGNKAGVKVIIYRNDRVRGDHNISDFRKIPGIIEGMNAKAAVF